jgi:hypothetical protein
MRREKDIQESVEKGGKKLVISNSKRLAIIALLVGVVED